MKVFSYFATLTGRIFGHISAQNTSLYIVRWWYHVHTWELILGWPPTRGHKMVTVAAVVA